MFPKVPHERRVTVALLCSGLLHAAIAMAATALIALTPSREPPSESGVVLQAVLQQAPAEVAPLEVQAPPEALPELITAPAPDIAVPVPIPTRIDKPPAPPPSPATTAPSMITSNDPNGSVTIGVVEGAAAAARSSFAATRDRYPPRVDKEPRMIGSLIVPYPPAAKQAHASGRIAAVMEIDERGQITSTALVPDQPMFGPAVLEALKEARFTPAEVATHPVPYWTVVEFVFAIAPGARPTMGSE